ncbi:cytochrome b N-terminal domain-containing protein [Planctomicrobium piriforme]|uniref:Ubiquinol-cytochrome c reductase cytochrome b subunit n=1 Tax=Planctomicrobium piriforme TaxID=1576369 RepID=A0A1I3PIL5_9PLAN|nr:cytochrome b N-terminal domain-containing protein [Planctomicrobium piriforme]SFJ21231.1 ubiquinol-cytochrome c reductase cytochrome b subunit [Planctomicrobium piriforme]
MQRALSWLDHRTGYRSLVKGAFFEPIPGGARWRYCWGTTLAFTFMLQMLTGICLWMSYSPSAVTAWESVFYIQHTMVLGWVVRGMHHFAAQAMMILLVIHLMQVVIDGAYRAPREINFWLGLVLMQIVMFMGLTGYLLPWDQKGYSATQVATGIMGSAPIAGPYVQQLVQGGTQHGHQILTRFFAMHAGILPACLIAVLSLHIYVFRRHGIHAVKTEGRPDGMYWPDQCLRDGVACLAVLAAVLTITFMHHGAELSAPADPGEAYAAARPEWYYLFLFKFLSFPWVAKMGAITGLGEAFGAILVPGMIMTVIVLMPITARLRYGHQFNIAFLWVVVGIAGALTSLAVHDDWFAMTSAGQDFRLAVRNAHRDAQRVSELALSPTGIPPQGAANLLRTDPLTQGPKLFQTYCISCHQPADGQHIFKEPPVAPELVDPHRRTEIVFASRDWIRNVLTKFESHFASLKNTQGERAEAAEAILTGTMKDWSDKNGPTLLEPENAADFSALVEFLYAQSARPDALPPNDLKVKRGQEIFATGKLASGTIDACTECHAMRPLTIANGALAQAQEALSEDLFPDLTGYGGTIWTAALISDPQKVYAGDSGNNAMPAFSGQLTAEEIQLLARWLSQDYYRDASAAAH